MYEIVLSRRCLEMSDDVIDHVLVVCVRIRFFAFASRCPCYCCASHYLRDVVGVCRAGYLIYADGVHDSFLHGADDFGPDTDS